MLRCGPALIDPARALDRLTGGLVAVTVDDDGNIAEYRVHMKVTFVLEED